MLLKEADILMFFKEANLQSVESLECNIDQSGDGYDHRISKEMTNLWDSRHTDWVIYLPSHVPNSW